MDPFIDKSADPEGRSSLRSSLAHSISRSEDEEEGHDLAEALISDGFRPTQQSLLPSLITTPLPPPQLTSQASSTNAQQLPLASTGPSLDRPSSSAKPSRTHDSLTLRHDGSETEGAVLPLGTLADVHQVRPQSPYRGPSGPSHPYQMYIQRTLSNATSSTAPVTTHQAYDGPRGPAQPYGLYDQNIVPTGNEVLQQHIPVGFSNVGNSYQRQIGPDGEEAGGLVGPLGHTEELPPYTRYPHQPIVPKVSGEESRETTAAVPAAVIPAVASRQAAADAGGIGVAARNPEFSATEEDLEPTPSCPSTASQHEINTAARDAAEKPPLNKWQRRAKRKLWGIIPYWAICLVALTVILIAIIMGAVIGTVLSHHSKGSKYDGKDPDDDDGPSSSAYTPTPTADIIPVPTPPANLAPLATGTFRFRQLTASQSPKGCFVDPNQSQAWSCDMPTGSYWLNITRDPKAADTLKYDISLTNPEAHDFDEWGMQPPEIKYPSELMLVTDVFGDGAPAWWFKFNYDKTVILTTDSFNPVPNPKRSDSGFFTDIEAPRQESRSDDKPGEMCWLCTWPNTSMEIFIYPNQDLKPPSTSSASPSYGQMASSSSSSSSPPAYPTNSLPVYPKAVKFVERRFSNPNSKVYCRKVEIINNGRGYENATDSNNQPIEVEIPEKPSAWKKKWSGTPDEGDEHEVYNRPRYGGHGPRSSSLDARKADWLTQCGCLWTSQ